MERGEEQDRHAPTGLQPMEWMCAKQGCSETLGQREVNGPAGVIEKGFLEEADRKGHVEGIGFTPKESPEGGLGARSLCL